jgi:acetyltransferase-like isoleucine patch superfamily enzyme
LNFGWRKRLTPKLKNMQENLFFNKNELKYCGSNVIIGKTVRIRQPHLASIGDNSIIDDFTYISSSIEIGRFCHIASNVNISGGGGIFKMLDYSTLSSHVSVHCLSSDYNSISLDLPSVPVNMQFGGHKDNIFIDKFVTVGAHSCILPGAFLPEGSAFGAYTLIKKRQYLKFHLYAGVSCRDLGLRDCEKFNLIKHKL